jgi:transposase
MRLAVAENSVAADIADDRREYAAAVESELRSLDAYLERLQTKAAMESDESREQDEAVIGDLRRRRIALAARVAQATRASDDAWHAQVQGLAAARAELERQTDELSKKLQERRWTE